MPKELTDEEFKTQISEWVGDVVVAIFYLINPEFKDELAFKIIDTTRTRWAKLTYRFIEFVE